MNFPQQKLGIRAVLIDYVRTIHCVLPKVNGIQRGRSRLRAEALTFEFGIFFKIFLVWIVKILRNEKSASVFCKEKLFVIITKQVTSEQLYFYFSKHRCQIFRFQFRTLLDPLFVSLLFYFSTPHFRRGGLAINSKAHN